MTLPIWMDFSHSIVAEIMVILYTPASVFEASAQDLFYGTRSKKS